MAHVWAYTHFRPPGAEETIVFGSSCIFPGEIVRSATQGGDCRPTYPPGPTGCLCSSCTVLRWEWGSLVQALGWTGAGFSEWAALGESLEAQTDRPMSTCCLLSSLGTVGLPGVAICSPPAIIHVSTPLSTSLPFSAWVMLSPGSTAGITSDPQCCRSLVQGGQQ